MLPSPAPLAYLLDETLDFPPPSLADESGLLAVGGDLKPERLLRAYSLGIFPWYHDGLPILWHCPDPRTVLVTRDLHVGRSLRKALRKSPYRITMDTSFEAVIRECAETPRPGQEGTWITDDMIDAYVELRALGHAHSVEAWAGDRLVGGLYGVNLGNMFFGESMFAHEADASKIAFVTFVRQLAAWGVELIDCQMDTEHLARFGSTSWPREQFLSALKPLVAAPSRAGTWRFDSGFDNA